MSEETNINFEDDDNVFLNQEGLKEVLVAEIDSIRGGLSVVNMFVGEPLKAVVEFLKVMDSKKS